MSITNSITQRELDKFRLTSSGMAIAVINPDGSLIGPTVIDESLATPGITTGIPAMGIYETSPSTLTNNQIGLVGLNANRAMKITLATALSSLIAGVENDIVGITPSRRADAFQAVYNGTSSSSPTTVKALTSAKTTYITDIVISTDTAQTVKIQDSAGSPLILIPPIYMAVNSIWSMAYRTPLVATSAKDVNVVCGGSSGNVSVQLTGYVI